LFKFRKSGFIGDFHNNEFWISKSTVYLISKGKYNILTGAFLENTDKTIIKCKLGISKPFMLSASVIFLLFFLFFGFPYVVLDGLEGILHHLAYSVGVILIINIIAYSITLYQYRLALRLIKEIFQCD